MTDAGPSAAAGLASSSSTGGSNPRHEHDHEHDDADRIEDHGDGNGYYGGPGLSAAPPTSWRDPRVGHAHHSRLERTLEAIGMGRYQLHLLLLTGTGWAADNAWMTAIPIVLPAVQAHFNVPDSYSGAMSSACFLGMMIGSLAWGSYSDTYGRLSSFTYTLAITTLFAIILPFSPSFSLLCFSLFLLGSGLGGSMPTDGTIFLENTPKSKQYLTVALSTFFSAGASVSSAWAIIVMPCRASSAPAGGDDDACIGSWRWRIYLAGLAVLTACFFLSRIFLFTLHESPRYLVSQGRTAEARRVLQSIVEYNDTTEREALESIARSAEPGASALSLPPSQNGGSGGGLLGGLHTLGLKLGKRGPLNGQFEDNVRNHSGSGSPHNGKYTSTIPTSTGSETPSDEQEEETSDADLEAGYHPPPTKRNSHSGHGHDHRYGLGPSHGRPRALDRGMSVRLSDVRTWTASADPVSAGSSSSSAARGVRPARTRLPSGWGSELADVEAGVEEGLEGGGTTRNVWADAVDAPAPAPAPRRASSTSPSRVRDGEEGERQGLLSGRASADHGRVYHDDSVDGLGAKAGRSAVDDEEDGIGPAASTTTTTTRDAPCRSTQTLASPRTRTASMQERFDALLSRRWRRTTLLTWGIWASLNLGYTLFNVFLPKMLEERERERGRGAASMTMTMTMSTTLYAQETGRTASQGSDARALWSYFAYALSSIPGPVIAAWLVETRWLGRRGTLALTLGLTSVLMLCLSSVLGHGGEGGGGGGQSGTTVLLGTISVSATTAYATLYGWTPELFDIELRGSGCGAASAAGRLASVVAPLVGGVVLGGGGGSSGLLCAMSAGLVGVSALFTLGLRASTGPS